MQFLREKQGVAERAIASQICEALFAGTRVLWLVSGGSNVASEVAIMEQVRNHCSESLERLAILPADERYGKPGHKNSNTQALRKAGFNPGTATWIDVLMHNQPFAQTVAFYNDIAAAALAGAAAVVGQFGLGADGHVAGILPGSEATDPTDATVVGYKWDDYTRMTLTPAALAKLHVAYVLAYGASKKIALERLQKHADDIRALPALALQSVPEVFVYNDVIKSKG